jgi:hypothetical protein
MTNPLDKVCATCGSDATHKFFAGRVSKHGNVVENMKVNEGKDLLTHNRFRYTCLPCYDPAKLRLENMSFKVNPIEPL